jgi:hypothetical protein
MDSVVTQLGLHLISLLSTNEATVGRAFKWKCIFIVIVIVIDVELPAPRVRKGERRDDDA